MRLKFCSPPDYSHHVSSQLVTLEVFYCRRSTNGLWRQLRMGLGIYYKLVKCNFKSWTTVIFVTAISVVLRLCLISIKACWYPCCQSRIHFFECVRIWFSAIISSYLAVAFGWHKIVKPLKNCEKLCWYAHSVNC